MTGQSKPTHLAPAKSPSFPPPRHGHEGDEEEAEMEKEGKENGVRETRELRKRARWRKYEEWRRGRERECFGGSRVRKE